jgi:hypothetical protein
MADKSVKKTQSVKEKDKKSEKDDKKKVEKDVEEEEEDSSDEEGPKVTRAGPLQLQLVKKKWTPFYCVLIGGSFFYYNRSSDPDPKGSVTLKDTKIISPAADQDKKIPTLAVTKGDKEELTVQCGSESDLELWLTALRGNVSMEAADPPSSSGKKKTGVLGRMYKKGASKGATSALGKKVMKAIVNEETTTLLEALKKIVKSESGSPKKAEDLEKNIIKIAVKSYLLVEGKKLSADDFLVADKPLREAFELMVKVFNGRKRVKQDKIEEALKKVESHLKKAEEVITGLLAPHLTPKNMLKISQAFGCIADVKFLITVFKNDELEEDLDKLVDAMEYYTQFHYH